MEIGVAPSYIPTNLQIRLCLKNVSNLLDLEYYCLKMLRVHSKCMGIMHHRLAQKRGIWRFSGGIGSIFA